MSARHDTTYSFSPLQILETVPPLFLSILPTRDTHIFFSFPSGNKRRVLYHDFELHYPYYFYPLKKMIKKRAASLEERNTLKKKRQDPFHLYTTSEFEIGWIRITKGFKQFDSWTRRGAARSSASPPPGRLCRRRRYRHRRTTLY